MLDRERSRTPDLRPGVAVLPEDFPERLRAFKEASGLSWRGLAVCLGVDDRQLLRWRKGVKPSGAAVYSMFRLSARVPQGPEILLGAMPADGRR